MTGHPQATVEWTDTDRRVIDLIRARVPVEPGIAQGWREFTVAAGECVSREHFGAPASYQTRYQQFGLIPERVAAAARSSIARTTGPEGQCTP